MKQIAHKRLDNITTITLGRFKVDELQKYFRKSHPPTILPPLFSEYVIKVIHSKEELERSLGGKFAKDITHEIYVWHEEPTKVYLLSFLDGKKQFDVEFDYSGAKVLPDCSIEVQSTATPLDSSDWDPAELKEAMNEITSIYRYVTYYMLYYKPDVQYVDRPQDRKRTSRSTVKPKQKDTFVLKSSVRRYTISVDEMPRSVNYNKMTWAVRGHFRKSKNGILIYVSPYTAHRKSASERKPHAKRYRIE